MDLLDYWLGNQEILEHLLHLLNDREVGVLCCLSQDGNRLSILITSGTDSAYNLGVMQTLENVVPDLRLIAAGWKGCVSGAVTIGCVKESGRGGGKEGRWSK